MKYPSEISDEKKRLFSNIFSLSMLQGANYILPLLTLPYLVRVLGPEYFGLLAFATATNAYFILVTNYGFNLSATQQISVHRDNSVKVTEIFSSVIIIKTMLLIFSAVMLILLIFCFDKFSDHWEVYVLSFGVVIGQVCSPIWLFQGMESMKGIAYINIGSKALFTAGVFVLVKEQSDYLVVPMLNSLGFIMAGIYSFALAKNQFKVVFKNQSISNVKSQLGHGWHIFISSMSISLYTISTTFILGMFTNYTVVGYFSAADKIIHAVKGIYVPISQAIYPLISKKINDDRQAGLSFIYKMTKIVSLAMLVLSTGLFFAAERIVNVFFGFEYYESIILLKIMSFLPLIVALSNIFGIQTLLTMGYKKEFTFFVGIGAIFGVFVAILLTPTHEAVGMASAILMVEILITTMLGLFVWHKFKRGIL